VIKFVSELRQVDGFLRPKGAKNQLAAVVLNCHGAVTFYIFYLNEYFVLY
jgi:hypothetical protein